MTISICRSHCRNVGSRYAALHGSYCYCSNNTITPRSRYGDRACSLKCSGNKFEACGASGYLSIYDGNPKAKTILYYITCTKILVLWLVESRSLFKQIIASGDKTSYCKPFGLTRVQKLFTIVLSVRITLECSVFPIQFSDVCSKNEANKKVYVRNSTRGKCSRRSACV